MRHWPSLIAAAVDLIDGRRWNLTPDQVRRALLLVPSGGAWLAVQYGRTVDPGFGAALDTAFQIERAWRGLLGSNDKIRIAGISATTGDPVTLPATVAAVAIFRFDANEVVLPGKDGARLIVTEIKERDGDGEGKSARRSSREKPFWGKALEAAFEWLVDEGCPAPGDRRQADLERYISEWLSARGHEAGEASIRRHVADWIAERRAELGI
jgi:hypothetical protein